MHRARGSHTCSKNSLQGPQMHQLPPQELTAKATAGPDVLAGTILAVPGVRLGLHQAQSNSCGWQTASLRCPFTGGLRQACAHQPLSARGGSCPIWPVASSSWLARDSRARGDTAPPVPADGMLRGGKGASLRGARSGGPAGTQEPASLLKQSAGLSLLQATLRLRWRLSAMQV